jgi:hypothetical protein
MKTHSEIAHVNEPLNYTFNASGHGEAARLPGIDRICRR